MARNGLPIVKKYEGCNLAAYQDSVGIWTIGWGHTGDVQDGDYCTQEQADQWLNDDYDQAQQIVLDNVTTDLTDNQLGALTSFVYNIGEGCTGKKDGFVHLITGGPSHLLIYCNRGDFSSAADQFLSWEKAGGVVLLGLQRRRIEERALFLT